MARRARSRGWYRSCSSAPSSWSFSSEAPDSGWQAWNRPGRRGTPALLWDEVHGVRQLEGRVSEAALEIAPLVADVDDDVISVLGDLPPDAGFVRNDRRLVVVGGLEIQPRPALQTSGAELALGGRPQRLGPARDEEHGDAACEGVAVECQRALDRGRGIRLRPLRPSSLDEAKRRVLPDGVVREHRIVDVEDDGGFRHAGHALVQSDAGHLGHRGLLDGPAPAVVVGLDLRLDRREVDDPLALEGCCAPPPGCAGREEGQRKDDDERGSGALAQERSHHQWFPAGEGGWSTAIPGADGVGGTLGLVLMLVTLGDSRWAYRHTAPFATQPLLRESPSARKRATASEVMGRLRLVEGAPHVLASPSARSRARGAAVSALIAPLGDLAAEGGHRESKASHGRTELTIRTDARRFGPN